MIANETIGPTPERLAKSTAEEVEVTSPDESENWRAIRFNDSPLAKLAVAGSKNPAKGITGEQFHAGMRFYADAYQAGLIPSKAMDMSRIRVDCEGFKDIPDYKIAAQTRYNRILKRLDSDSYIILSCVVIQEQPMNDFADRYREFVQARERRAIALNLFRKALSQLDAFYYPKRRDGIVSAATDDARPVIQPADASA